MFASKKVFHIFLVQVIAMQLLFANASSSQKLSDIKLTLALSDARLEEVLVKLNTMTGFRFGYDRKTVTSDVRFTFSGEEMSLEALLLNISEKGAVRFKRINNQILVLNDAASDSGERIETVAAVPVRGTIRDMETGEALVGATVLVKGTAIGTITDLDGNFALSIPEDADTLVVSYIGYETISLAVAGQTTFEISLKPSSSALNEVVVIGYGTTTKEDLTTAVSSATNVETIDNRPVRNVGEFLQGNIPGVTVLSPGGDPTSTPNIVIRGVGSFSDNSPLYVVDGVPYYGPQINPNDIESIDVLKDASAAAIYGAQAASGVIVITTKKGKAGKPQVTLDTYTGISQAYNLPTALNAKQQADAYVTAAANNTTGSTSPATAYVASENPWGQVTRTNWIDEIFRNANVSNINLNVSGASDKVNYMTSFGYNKQEGLLIGTDYSRYSLRVKTDYNVNKKLMIGENLYVSHSEAIGTNTSSSYSGSIINAIYMPRSATVYDADGNFGGTVPDSLSDLAGAYGDVYNPVALLLRPTTHNPLNYVNGNAYLSYELLKGLTFKSTFMYSFTDEKYKQFYPEITEIGHPNDQNYLYQSYANTNLWNWTNQVNYERSFGKHNLNATGVYAAQEENYEYFYEYGTGFSSEASWNQYMENATTIYTPVTEAYKTTLTSMIGRLMYNYDHKYYLTASIRQDKSSKLYGGNRKGVFPSVSAAWRVSGESFFNIPVINNLKVRASWGQIGNINSVGNYAYDATLGTSTVTLGEDASYAYKGVYSSTQSNKNLKWETSESTDVGVDVSFLNSKFQLTADYFIKQTKQLILEGQADEHLGTDPADVNGGLVRNEGIELALTYSDAIGKLHYSVGGNVSHIKNRLMNLHGFSSTGMNYVSDDDNVREVLYPFRSTTGQPLYSYYLVKSEGTFKSQAEIDAYTKDGELIQPNARPGDLKFKDVNGDGTISSDDKVYVGCYMPKLTYGFNLNFNYQNFDLSMVFQGVAGVKIFNGYKYSTYSASLAGYNMDNRVLNAWSATNTQSNIPILSTSDENQNFGTASTWYLERGDYLRMKNLTLGYRLPESVLSGFLDGASLRVYGSIENLFTVTKYSGMDPEVGGNGLDLGRYPVSRKFVAGLSFTF